VRFLADHTFEPCACKVGGSSGAREVGVCEVCSGEVGVAEVGVCQVCSGQFCSGEVGVAEVGAAEVGAAEVRVRLNLLAVHLHTLTRPRRENLSSAPRPARPRCDGPDEVDFQT